jgi:predicted MFS family arabinose efflux permease
MAAAGLGSSLPYFYATYGAVTGLGHSALGSVPNMVVVSQWFPRATGRAIALADIGTALGVILIVPAAQWVILQVGWRATLWALAAFIVLVLVPVNLRQGVPGHSVSRPDGNGRGSTGADAPGDARTMRAALARGAFWWLVLARLTSGLAFQMMMVHMIPYAIGAGYGKLTAASLLGVVSAVSMAGRFLVGVAADRLGRGLAATLAYASASAGILALMQIQTAGMGALAIFVLLYGLSQGSSGIVVAARAADLFQGRHFGRIYGWISITSGAGEALGAWLGGAVYDLTGSYRLAFYAALVALAGGAATLWMTYVGEITPRPKRA